MARPDAAAEATLTRYAEEVRAALGEALVCVAVRGSAAGEDWVTGQSDLNPVIVVAHLGFAVLEALAPVVGRWRARGVSLPVLMDREYLERARDIFPMELEDIRRQHRLLAGTDVFASLRVERAALRQECEREAREKLLRLRAHYLDSAAAPAAVERLLLESVKSFLVIFRHLLWLRGLEVAPAYPAVLAAGETLLGPLPAMRTVLARRVGEAGGHAEFAAYLAEVERLVTAVDQLDA